MRDRYTLIFGIAIITFMGLVLYRLYMPSSKRQIKVYVCGAVRSSGVYTLQQGARVQDAIKSAGGTLPNADLSNINLAKHLRDGDMVKVPFKTELLIKISINTATVEQLSKLPGISSSLAKRIVKYRELNGPYLRISELLNVDGMTVEKLERIKPYIEL